MKTISHNARAWFRATCILTAALAAAQGVSAEQAGAALKVGVLSDADSLPLLVARDEGLFEKAGAKVELVRFQSAIERDAALQAGSVDGTVSDLLALVLMNQNGFAVRATSLTDGRYGLAAKPGSSIASAAELGDVAVGLSTNTVIQYAAETMEAKAGVPRERIKGIAVPKMPVRLELLLSGQLEAACLPEPLLSVACAKGAKLLAASDDSGLGAGIIMFSKAALDSKMEGIAAFYRGYAAAAAAIDAKSDSYRGYLVDKAGFPAEARDAFRFVVYREPRLPSPEAIASVAAWLKAKSVLAADAKVDPAALVDGRPLPAAGAR
jgi:ABC-type nitrate/sulfonate/bicarbonate transport systems, periplasmic components